MEQSTETDMYFYCTEYVYIKLYAPCNISERVPMLVSVWYYVICAAFNKYLKI